MRHFGDIRDVLRAHPDTGGGKPLEPTLSVVLPNYNHAALIPRALEALLRQERPPDEIIVVDDASQDDSRAVIAQFALHSPKIRLISNPRNLGVVPTLRRGHELAQGRYVYFAAADDWVLPGFFVLALEVLEAHPRSGLFCGEAVLIDGPTGRIRGYRPIARPVSRAAEISASRTAALLARLDNWFLTGSVVYRREAVITAGGLDARYGTFADGVLSRKIALTRGFSYAPHVVAVWCVFPGGASRTTALGRPKEALERIERLLVEDPAFPAWYPELFSRRWCFATSRLALECEPPDRTLVRTMGTRTHFDRRIVDLVFLCLPTRLARPVILAWLWLRLRPTSLIGVVKTLLLRSFERLRQTAGHHPALEIEKG